jgi:hypothetical protein
VSRANTALANKIFKPDMFERIANHGIGNPRSGLAHSMCYFRGRLYVGVTHSSGTTPDDAARILRYDPTTSEWEEVYRSPLVKSDEKAAARMPNFALMRKLSDRRGQRETVHDLVPRERGFRGMTVLQKKGNRGGILCVSTLSHWGSQLLCSKDGEQFTSITEPGLGDPNILSFRCVVPFKGKVFLAPVGSVKGDVIERNLSDIAKLYVTDDPFSGKWFEAMEPGFGDPCNVGIFSVAVYKKWLYVGTSNPTRGFEIWKTTADGKPPYEWHKVIGEGAYRYNLNHTAATLVEFKDWLYVSSALPGLGEDKNMDVGPAAAEILRFNKNDEWDLIAGTPRFTPVGVKVPLSLMGPGFGDSENSVFWAIAAHDECLYAGSHNNTIWRNALSGAREMTGGFHLWASCDGETWSPITLDGFGDPYSCGVRTMVSTPHGLFLGTLNHRDVERLWFRLTGRQGDQLGTGGCDIYLARTK